MATLSPLLVSAGEASGDHLAAHVVRALNRPTFGLGGTALAAAGTELHRHVQTTARTGFFAPLSRLPALLQTANHLLHLAKKNGVRHALLVDFPEFHTYLGRRLRRQGVRVLWLAAPQVWAWRPGRLRSLQPCFDRLAVLFSFEETLWRRAGADAHWVGHPLAEVVPLTRLQSRQHYGLPPDGHGLALLPGSRSQQVRTMLPPMLVAASAWRQQNTAPCWIRLLLSDSLPPRDQAYARALARRVGCDTLSISSSSGALPALGAFNVSYCTAGTATLEAALAEAPPVIVYRTDPISAYLARRWVQIRSMGLPNILLGQSRYPERFQQDLTADNLLNDTFALLQNESRWHTAATELRATLLPSESGSMGTRTARLLESL